MLVKAVLDRVRKQLKDGSDVRWLLDDKLRAFNAAQKLIAEYKHDSCATIGSVKLAAGIRQSIPAGGLRFLELLRNMGADGQTPGRAITYADKADLDALRPDWTAAPARQPVQHYLFDPARKTEFYVTPPVPASPAVYVEVKYVRFPKAIPLKTDSPPFEEASDETELPEDFEEALFEYVCFRCLDGEDEAANEQQAAKHEAAFYRALGIKREEERDDHAANRAQPHGRPPRAETMSA